MKRVYFNEFNVLIGNTTYFPLVSGLLHANALTSAKVRAHYQFMPYLFHIDAPENILEQYDRPAVAAFSLLMWNEQLNLTVAREVKRRYPDCVIVVGGAQVPHHPGAYFEKYPFIDVAIRGEGEEPFTEVLEKLADGQGLQGLPNVSWRDADGVVHVSDTERPFARDLDVYPSPYLEGLYDELIRTRTDMTFQAIVETNRGCPFHCTFCYWGKGGLSRKYRYHGIDRISAEFEWMGRNKIRYLFNADSNFGMNKRDLEIAEYLVEVKNKYGFPERFRTCYGKNTDEKIIGIGNLFHRNNIEKGITISYQSTSEQVQKNIKRDNIKISVARDLHKKFNSLDIPVYTELIVGLPGETVESWLSGIDEVLSSGLKNQLYVYCCQVYPNTELDDPDYKRNFGIVTQRVALNEIHGSVRRADWVTEYEDIIVTTNSMTLDDWKRMLMVSWMVMLLHSMKAGFYVSCWLLDRFKVRYSDFVTYLLESGKAAEYPNISRQIAMFEDMIEGILRGQGRGVILPEFGPLYWDLEEAAFLDLARDFPAFFAELEMVVGRFLTAQGKDYDVEELAEVIRYQALRLPSPAGAQAGDHRFRFNLPEYFDLFFSDERIAVSKAVQTLSVKEWTFNNSLVEFARETTLWGRKNNGMLTTAAWRAE